MKYESTTSSGKKVRPWLKFSFKVGQTSRSRSQGKKLWYQVKGLVTRNTHVQYASPITSGLKVMAKAKVFVHATDADTDGRAMTLAPRTYTRGIWKVMHIHPYNFTQWSEKKDEGISVNIRIWGFWGTMFK